MVKLLKMAVGHVLIAADQPNDVASGNEAVAANSCEDQQTPISDCSPFYCFGRALKFRQSLLQTTLFLS
jgi:hypothetical protein